MTDTAYHCIFAACLAFGVWGRSVDHRSSLAFVRYGQQEGVTWWKDRYGFFDGKKALIWTVIGFAALIALYVVTYLSSSAGYAQLASFIFVMIGVQGWAYGSSNRRHARDNREKQNAALDSNFEGWELYRPVDQNQGGRWCYRLFPWVYVEPMPQGMTERDIRPLLIAELRRLNDVPRFSDVFFKPRRIEV